METLFQINPLVIAAIPVALGLVQVAKTLKVPSKFAPLVSIAIGIILMLFVPDLAWQAIGMQGLIVGLAASGLWSGGKAVAVKNE